MIFSFIIFFTFAFVILGGSHYLLYYLLVRLLSITSSVIKLHLLIALIVLAVSFVASSAITHWKENILTQAWYVVSAFWVGLFVNLLIFAIGGMIVIALFNFAGIKEQPFFGYVFVILGILFSIYGTWNAFHPVVKNIDVALKNLPETWKGKTVVQISDAHLGSIHTPGLFAKDVDRINALNPDLILITGDLFDGMDGMINDFVEPLNRLKAKDGIFFVTGNHETYLGTNAALAVIKKTGIRILNDEEVEVNGLQIVGLSYPERGLPESGSKKDIAGIFKKIGFDRNKPSILLFHTPTNISEFKKLGVNLQLAGHTHKGQMWPFGYITKMIFKGYDYGLKTDGDYNEYTTNGLGTWGPPMRTGNTPEIVRITLR